MAKLNNRRAEYPLRLRITQAQGKNGVVFNEGEVCEFARIIVFDRIRYGTMETHGIPTSETVVSYEVVRRTKEGVRQVFHFTPDHVELLASKEVVEDFKLEKGCG